MADGGDGQILQFPHTPLEDAPPPPPKPKQPSHAAQLLRQAETLIDGDRDAQHGDRYACTLQISRLWTAYLGVPVTQQDFCNMMALVKIGRIQTGAHNPDNARDGAGYLVIGDEVSIVK